jgi:hypothetical protein
MTSFRAKMIQQMQLRRLAPGTQQTVPRPTLLGKSSPSPVKVSLH